MHAQTVLAKTAKGNEEVRQRGHHLSGKLRALLITVDGRTSAGEITDRSLAPAETLAALEYLLAEGYVEDRAGRSSAPPADAEGAADSQQLALVQRFMVTSMLDALGADADYFTGRIEDARTTGELAALAEQYIEVVRVGGGAKRAEAFRSGCLAHGLLHEEKPATQPPAQADTPLATP